MNNLSFNGTVGRDLYRATVGIHKEVKEAAYKGPDSGVINKIVDQFNASSVKLDAIETDKHRFGLFELRKIASQDFEDQDVATITNPRKNSHFTKAVAKFLDAIDQKTIDAEDKALFAKVKILINSVCKEKGCTSRID